MDRYHIYESIGKGKHSVVYKGREKKTIQYYAVKSVEKSQRQRVLQEVHALRAIKHERTLKFVAWYETRNHLWLVLEYCVGGTLLNVLKQDGRLPESSIRRFAVDLCRGLRALHGAGLLHCDVKPSNALLSEHGEVKLCGFGLSRRVASNVAMLSSSHGNINNSMGSMSRTSMASSSTSSHGMGNSVNSSSAGGGFTSSRGSGHLSLAKRGSPAYMAPELFTTIGVHSYASDLWALGCVLYEFVAGYPPFSRNRLSELVEAVLEEEPEPLPRERCSESLESLIMGLLVKRPHQRMTWQDVVEHEFFRRPVPAPSSGTTTSNPASNERGGRGDVTLSIKKFVEEHKKKPLPKETAFEQMAQKLKAEDLAARLKSLNPKSPGSNVAIVHGGLLTASLRQSCDVSGLSRAARTNLDRERSALGYGVNGASNKGNNNHSGNVNVNVTVDAEKNYFDSENRNSVDVVMETADFEVNFALENFMNDENNCATNASHEESFKDARDGNQRVSINSTTSSVAEYAEKRRTTPMKAPAVQRLCTVNLPTTPARTPKRNGREGGNSGSNSDDNVEYHEAVANEDDDGENDDDYDNNNNTNNRKKEKNGSVVIMSPDAPNGRRKKSLLDNRRSAGGENALLKSPSRGAGNREQHQLENGRDSRTMMAKTPWKHKTIPSDLDETMDGDEEDGNDDDPNALAIVADGDDDDDDDDASDCDESAYSVSTLSTHASDLIVRPIVNNRRVEPNGSAMDPVHDAKALPFPALDVKSVLSLSRLELEAFLTAVYRSVAESSPMRSKVNALAYFETLCSNAEAANVLVNSSLASMFVEVLAQSKAPTLRTRLCSILGLLFRHATEIGDELLVNEKTNICETLAEVIEDSNERAKRKAMATLGELLFYVATQSEREVSFDDDADGVKPEEEKEEKSDDLHLRSKAKVGPETAAVIWGVSDKVLAAVCSKLNVTEDAITRHYTTKTIENIVTPRCEEDDDDDDRDREEHVENECKHPKWVQDTFLTNSTLAKLFEIALADQRESENARVTASSAAARCLASSPKLLVDFATSSVCAHYISRLISDDSSKVSGNGLRCLNVVLSNEASKSAFLDTLRTNSSGSSGGDTGDVENKSTSGSSFYADENILAKELSLISERGANSINRGKALVAISALCSAHPAWLVHFTNNRILYVAEKVTLHANNDVYLTRCAECLFRTIADLSRRALDAISSEARRIIADANEKLSLETFDVNDVRRIHFSQSGATALFPALAHALCVGFMRDRVCDEAFLRKVSVFIQAAAIALPSATAAPLEEMDTNNNTNNRSPSKWFSGFRGGNTASKERVFYELLDRKNKASEEFRLGVSSLLETLSRDAQKNLLRFPKVTIREVLPALAKLLRGSDSPDARFLALKLTCDSMLPLLALQPVKIDYENARSNAEEMREEAARGDANSVCQIDADDKRYLTESLRMDFLPSCPALLMDEDPIPLYALKLLAGSMNNCGAEEEENANARGDEALEKALAHFASKFFAFLSLDHANNNAHNARLCLFLCRSKNSILSTRKLFTELNACERVADVLVYSRENRVEPFVEPASKMCEVLAKRAMQALEDTNTDSAEGEDLIDASLRGMRTFAEISQTFLECTTAAIDDETAITYAEAAAEALRVSCVVHPDVATQSLLVLPSSTSSSSGVVHSPGGMGLSGGGDFREIEQSHPFCESLERFASDAFESLLSSTISSPSDDDDDDDDDDEVASRTRERLANLRSKVIDAVANAFTAVANEGLTFHEGVSREHRERAGAVLGKLALRGDLCASGASRASRSFAVICRPPASDAAYA